MRPASLVLLVGALAVLLAGCSGTPQPVTSSTSAGRPPAFPRIDGTVVGSSESPPGDWVVTVRVTDPPAAYRQARALLVSKGYQLTLDEPVVDGGNGQACTTAQCVAFSALDRPGVGRTVQYEVFHSTGVVGLAG